MSVLRFVCFALIILQINKLCNRCIVFLIVPTRMKIVHYRLLSYILFLSLLLFLSSCIHWIQVSTHSYSDSVGKEVYILDNRIEEKEIDIYCYNGKYYAMLPYIKVSAKGKLLSFKYSDIPKTIIYDYPVVQHSTINDNSEQKLVCYEVELTRDNDGISAFVKNQHPLSNINLNSIQPVYKARLIYQVPQSPFAPVRHMENYCMLSATAPLFVVDSVLSITATLGAHMLYNLPKMIYLVFKETLC